MANITGTSGSDSLIGTSGADVLTPLGTTVIGGQDVVSGLDGADVYDLRRGGAGTIQNFLISDQGTDGATDSIINAGALFQSASFAYQGWATALQSGDNLVIHLPSRPYRFHHPGAPAYDIVIEGHYAGAQIETMQAGGVTYNLAASAVGTAVADIMAGTRFADTLSAGDGDDWMFGNGGRDMLDSGLGNDVVFGGGGRDTIDSGDGNDRVFGQEGNDRIKLGAGSDQADGDAGKDRIWGGDGNDWIKGGDGNDVLVGGRGQDAIDGGAGNDRMNGGADGDVYSFAAGGVGTGWGHDTIKEAHRPGTYLNEDKLSFGGLYGPSSGSAASAYSRISFTRDGNDMLVSLDGGTSTVKVVDMFDGAGGPRFVEQVEFNAGYWAHPLFQVLSAGIHPIGDDRNPANSDYRGAANEIIFGSDAGDLIYGDAGTNFIWTGAGADTLIYKENDSQPWYSSNLSQIYGSGGTTDIVQDFDVTQDHMDFTEIASVTSLADLTVSHDANGDALISWNSGTWEVSNIAIELRGVTEAQVTADLFVFV